MSFFQQSSVRVLKLRDWLELAANKESCDFTQCSEDLKNFKVVLPMIQRGFVWKPSQIYACLSR